MSTFWQLKCMERRCSDNIGKLLRGDEPRNNYPVDWLNEPWNVLGPNECGADSNKGYEQPTIFAGYNIVISNEERCTSLYLQW